VASRIVDNLARVRQQIADAAHRSRQAPSEITLVAVTKYVDVDTAASLLDAGCVNLGESRPQELWKKADALPSRQVNWHLIGHLQRNKVRRTLPHVTLLQSCDSTRLLEEVNRVAADLNLTARALLEVNISGDETKHGFAPEELERVLETLPSHGNLEVCGLMAMASLHGDLDAARRDFERLRVLRDGLTASSSPAVALKELSMGMSRDFEVAIEEGATIVRVGSALFDGIDS
jgi:hypothetical protein